VAEDTLFYVPKIDEEELKMIEAGIHPALIFTLRRCSITVKELELFRLQHYPTLYKMLASPKAAAIPGIIYDIFKLRAGIKQKFYPGERAITLSIHGKYFRVPESDRVVVEEGLLWAVIYLDGVIITKRGKVILVLPVRQDGKVAAGGKVIADFRRGQNKRSLISLPGLISMMPAALSWRLHFTNGRYQDKAKLKDDFCFFQQLFFERELMLFLAIEELKLVKDLFTYGGLITQVEINNLLTPFLSLFVFSRFFLQELFAPGGYVPSSQSEFYDNFMNFSGKVKYFREGESLNDIINRLRAMFSSGDVENLLATLREKIEDRNIDVQRVRETIMGIVNGSKQKGKVSLPGSKAKLDDIFLNWINAPASSSSIQYSAKSLREWLANLCREDGINKGSLLGEVCFLEQKGILTSPQAKLLNYAFVNNAFFPDDLDSPMSTALGVSREIVRKDLFGYTRGVKNKKGLYYRISGRILRDPACVEIREKLLAEFKNYIEDNIVALMLNSEEYIPILYKAFNRAVEEGRLSGKPALMFKIKMEDPDLTIKSIGRQLNYKRGTAKYRFSRAVSLVRVCLEKSPKFEKVFAELVDEYMGEFIKYVIPLDNELRVPIEEIVKRIIYGRKKGINFFLDLKPPQIVSLCLKRLFDAKATYVKLGKEYGYSDGQMSEFFSGYKRLDWQKPGAVLILRRHLFNKAVKILEAAWRNAPADSNFDNIVLKLKRLFPELEGKRIELDIEKANKRWPNLSEKGSAVNNLVSGVELVSAAGEGSKEGIKSLVSEIIEDMLAAKFLGEFNAVYARGIKIIESKFSPLSKEDRLYVIKLIGIAYDLRKKLEEKRKSKLFDRGRYEQGFGKTNERRISPSLLSYGWGGIPDEFEVVKEAELLQQRRQDAEGSNFLNNSNSNPASSAVTRNIGTRDIVDITEYKRIRYSCERPILVKYPMAEFIGRCISMIISANGKLYIKRHTPSTSDVVSDINKDFDFSLIRESGKARINAMNLINEDEYVYQKHPVNLEFVKILFVHTEVSIFSFRLREARNKLIEAGARPENIKIQRLEDGAGEVGILLLPKGKVTIHMKEVLGYRPRKQKNILAVIEYFNFLSNLDTPRITTGPDLLRLTGRDSSKNSKIKIGAGPGRSASSISQKSRLESLSLDEPFVFVRKTKEIIKLMKAGGKEKRLAVYRRLTAPDVSILFKDDLPKTFVIWEEAMRLIVNPNTKSDELGILLYFILNSCDFYSLKPFFVFEAVIELFIFGSDRVRKTMLKLLKDSVTKNDRVKLLHNFWYPSYGFKKFFNRFFVDYPIEDRRNIFVDFITGNREKAEILEILRSGKKQYLEYLGERVSWAQGVFSDHTGTQILPGLDSDASQFGKNVFDRFLIRRLRACFYNPCLRDGRAIEAAMMKIAGEASLKSTLALVPQNNPLILQSRDWLSKLVNEPNKDYFANRLGVEALILLALRLGGYREKDTQAIKEFLNNLYKIKVTRLDTGEVIKPDNALRELKAGRLRLVSMGNETPCEFSAKEFCNEKAYITEMDVVKNISPFVLPVGPKELSVETHPTAAVSSSSIKSVKASRSGDSIERFIQLVTQGLTTEDVSNILTKHNPWKYSQGYLDKIEPARIQELYADEVMNQLLICVNQNPQIKHMLAVALKIVDSLRITDSDNKLSTILAVSFTKYGSSFNRLFVENIINIFRIIYYSARWKRRNPNDKGKQDIDVSVFFSKKQKRAIKKKGEI